MARYLDPKNDLTFKRIFGEHPDLLIGFLNAVMPLSPNRLITEVEYLPPEQAPENPGKKNSIVDVKCKDKSGRVFIIEMQMLWTDDFTSRIVFNASKAYVRQLDKSVSYHHLKPVYTLAILNENFDNKTEHFYHHYSIVNRENTEEVIEGLEFVLVELLKFKSEKWSERRIAALWLQFLRDVDEKMTSLPQELAENEQIRKAAELCEEAAFTPEELAAYEAYWDLIRTEKTIREGSLAKGEAIGLAKGEAERNRLKAEKEAAQAKLEAAQAEKEATQAKLEAAQAEKEAAQAEKEAAQEKLEAAHKTTVINSHCEGLTIGTISTITGLTSVQINEILKINGLI